MNNRNERLAGMYNKIINHYMQFPLLCFLFFIHYYGHRLISVNSDSIVINSDRFEKTILLQFKFIRHTRCISDLNGYFSGRRIPSDSNLWYRDL
jgi:hypothetical protein